MAYTVKQLAELSGVSIRTLHHYDALGLLEPAYCGANGYRFYEEEQVLLLQQVLFYRELGLGLSQIQELLNQGNHDKVKALKTHRELLHKEIDRQRQLIVTIDKTIQHLKGKNTMESKELFKGFDPDKQREHEQYLIDRYGDDMKQSIAKSKARVKDWSKQKWEQTRGEFAEICEELVAVMEHPLPADSKEAQDLIRRHFEWLCQFWTPNQESYIGHTHLILDSELRNAYTAHHGDLPVYLAEGIRTFAERELE